MFKYYSEKVHNNTRTLMIQSKHNLSMEYHAVELLLFVQRHILQILTHYILSKVIKPDIILDKVSQLNEKNIEKIKQKYGIEGIILDVDDTLRKEMKDIPKCNKDWIESLREKVKIVILSNGKDKKIEQYFNEKGIDYIGFAHKPLKKNFIKACEQMNISPNKVLVVGDSLFDDIYGGKKNNMRTALVNEVEDNDI